MIPLLIYITSAIGSYVFMISTGEDIDKKLENEHLKRYNEENLNKYIIPVIPSLIPVLNIVVSVYLQKNFDEVYNTVREIKCRSLMSDGLEKTYDSLKDFKKEEFKEDLIKSINILKNKDFKEKVLYTIDKKYSDPDIEYFELNESKDELVVVNDDYLEDKTKVKQLKRTNNN